MTSRRALPPWLSASPPTGHPLETERRLTTLEIVTDAHGQGLEEHASRHGAQDVWNKAFTVALLGLGSGLAHAKAGDLIEFAVALLKGFKP